MLYINLKELLVVSTNKIRLSPTIIVTFGKVSSASLYRPNTRKYEIIGRSRVVLYLRT